MKRPIPSSVAVIGRGIAGLTCAYRFAQAGFRVSVFGRKQKESMASRVATGLSCVKGHRIAEQPLFNMKVAGHYQLRKLLKELEAQSQSQLIFEGVYEPFANLSEYKDIAEKVFRKQFRGLFGNARAYLSDLGCYGFYYPKDFFFDPGTVLDCLEKELSKMGVGLYEQQIHRVSTGHRQGSVKLFVKEEAAAPNEHPCVILAAGSGSYDILQNSGFNVQSLGKVWGETLLARMSQTVGNRALTKLGFSTTCIDGFARTGASSLGGERPALDATECTRLTLTRQHHDFYKASSSLERFEAGVRLRTRSRLPLVGELPLDASGKSRLRLATAYFRNGFQFADLAACFHVSHVLNPDHNDQHFEYSDLSARLKC